MGTVSDIAGKIYDHIKLTVSQIPESPQSDRAVTYREVFTDGSGWYGLTELPPGGYRVTIASEEFSGERTRDVIILPGRVAEADFRSVPEVSSESSEKTMAKLK